MKLTHLCFFDVVTFHAFPDILANGIVAVGFGYQLLSLFRILGYNEKKKIVFVVETKKNKDNEKNEKRNSRDEKQ